VLDARARALHGEEPGVLPVAARGAEAAAADVVVRQPLHLHALRRLQEALRALDTPLLLGEVEVRRALPPALRHALLIQRRRGE
jgi:hypothetical protein